MRKGKTRSVSVGWAAAVLVFVLCLGYVGAGGAAGGKVKGSKKVSKGVSEKTQVGLDVALNQPVLLANKNQSAYVRVALTGFAPRENERRAPVNIAVVIDKSGSMSGEKIEKAREAAILAIRRLNADDIISVVTYDTTVHVLIPATKVSDKERIFQKIRQIRANGSTALFAGVSKGAAELRKFLAGDRVNRLILLSDGLANVGPQTPAELGNLGGSLIKEGISVTTIGLGTNYNEDLMTKLAARSDGGHYFAEHASELAGVFEKEFGRALSVVAQEIRMDIRCAPGVRPVRFLGREDGEIQGQNARIFTNHLYSEHEKVFILEVEVPATEEGLTRGIASVSVRYDNMRTHATDKLTSTLEASFTVSKALVEKKTNANVAVDVVELIATERNILAMQLRDKGQLQEANRILGANVDYLNANSLLYHSKKLKDYGGRNEADLDLMQDEALYKKNRKQMRETQYWNLRR